MCDIKPAIYRCMPERNIMKLIEYIRWWRVDMNFMFEWQEHYLLSREHKIHIFELTCNFFYFSYKHTDHGVFDDFPKISVHFPKLSEDFTEWFRRPSERARTFSENFRKFAEMPEDFRGRPEDVSMIHQRI